MTADVTTTTYEVLVQRVLDYPFIRFRMIAGKETDSPPTVRRYAAYRSAMVTLTCSLDCPCLKAESVTPCLHIRRQISDSDKVLCRRM